MKTEKPKENKCRIVYQCYSINEDCNRYVKGKDQYCKFFGMHGRCISMMANTNAMVLALQDMGFNVEIKGGKE